MSLELGLLGEEYYPLLRITVTNKTIKGVLGRGVIHRQDTYIVTFYMMHPWRFISKIV